MVVNETLLGYETLNPERSMQLIVHPAFKKLTYKSMSSRSLGHVHVVFFKGYCVQSCNTTDRILLTLQEKLIMDGPQLCYTYNIVSCCRNAVYVCSTVGT